MKVEAKGWGFKGRVAFLGGEIGRWILRCWGCGLNVKDFLGEGFGGGWNLACGGGVVSC